MQKFIVELIGVFTQKDLPEDYEKFVEYKATMLNREVSETDKIAVLKVKDTTSYQILFLDDYNSMDEIDKEIDETLDGKIYNFNIRKILEGHLNG
ncbi:MAG: DUF749 family protein [Methanosphaera sp.]|uniref:DUF749 family protein n=1 Tax=Methanosphaera sp. ISO3-F5 TaxID=1452353 RepID=UPI002B25C9D6|nr:DUF749 family protein [Methanosphaera sp. ISO3-F5]MBR0471584.1 DUF749 family protein [Methanosphaera sp.]WQH64707.1 DUF749 family protein [Methanosphaera sp. ISO3-F5]